MRYPQLLIYEGDGRLAAHLVYAGGTLRGPQSALAANRQGQPGLWRHGISGDRPIVRR